jgi:transcriptional regulator with XRE-family HTH domain
MDTIKRLRTERGMSLEELAKKSGVSVATLREIEKGGDSDQKTLARLAKELNVNCAFLKLCKDAFKGNENFKQARIR